MRTAPRTAHVQLAALELDVLFCQDIGMDRVSCFHCESSRCRRVSGAGGMRAPCLQRLDAHSDIAIDLATPVDAAG